MKQTFTIQLVACIGKMQSGKDTLAEHLINFKRFAFADKLKETAYMLGWNGLKDEKGRWLLQQLGTEIGRTYDKKVWINHLLDGIRTDIIQNLKTHEKSKLNFIITDCRYLNEVEELRKFTKSVNDFFGYEIMKMSTVKIIRPSLNQDGEKHNHTSEMELDQIQDIDYTIINDGDFQDYIQKCSKFEQWLIQNSD
jgi:dephospho-CoA kinase